jgi:hypothetical protein
MTFSLKVTFRFLTLLLFLLNKEYKVDAQEFEPRMNNTKASCLNARFVDNPQGNYCKDASWTSAYIYAAANFSDYYTGTPLSDVMQNNLAMNIFEDFRAGHQKTLSSECKNALQRLACVTAFPECPLPGTSESSISYFLPCRLQCEQANAYCPFTVSCESYPSINCMLQIPSGFFVIDPISGPFEPLPIIYAISLAFWVMFAIAWNYLTFVKFRGSCVLFCRTVSGIPILKVLVLTFGTVFWSTGVKWKMFSFWMGVALVNTQLVYETGQMLVFLLIAKGWTITRDSFPANEVT